MDDIDLGPDEHELQLSSSEIESANFKEIARLKRELQKNHGHIDSVKLRVSAICKEILNLPFRPYKRLIEICVYMSYLLIIKVYSLMI